MDQEQVDVVQAERLERVVEGPAGLVGLVRVVAQLAGDEHVGAVEAGSADRLADFLLVAVHFGGVDVPVAGLQRAAYRSECVLRLDQEDAEAELRMVRPLFSVMSGMAVTTESSSGGACSRECMLC